MPLLFLRAPNSVYVHHKTCCLLTYFVSIFMGLRNSEHHADMALSRTPPLTSFSKVLGRTACLRTRILPVPHFCKRVVVRDIIFHFFLCKVEQDVSSKPEGEYFLLKWWGKSGEPKQDFDEERLPILGLDLCMVKKEWWPPSQSSWGPCAAKAASLFSSHSLGVGKSFSLARRIYFSQQAPMPHSQESTCWVWEKQLQKKVHFVLWKQDFLLGLVTVSIYLGQMEVQQMIMLEGKDKFSTSVWKKLYIKISNNKQMKAHILKGKLLLLAQKKKLLFLFSVKHTTRRQFLTDIITALTYLLHMQCVC